LYYNGYKFIINILFSNILILLPLNCISNIISKEKMHCKLLRNNSFVTNMAGPGSHIDLFLFPRSNLAILNKTAGIRALFGKQ
jgi:hypothetical protein